MDGILDAWDDSVLGSLKKSLNDVIIIRTGSLTVASFSYITKDI